MRSLIAAFTISFVMVSTSASADDFQTWTDPSGRLRFEHPADWPIVPLRTDAPGEVRVMTGAAQYECQMFLLPHAGSASAPPDAVRQHYARPVPQTEWANMIAPLGYFHAAPTVQDPSVDVSGAWPVQRATLTGDANPVYATLQGRPGIELISVCHSFDNVDRKTTFDQIAASLSTP
jgi:hypothetical protein